MKKLLKIIAASMGFAGVVVALIIGGLVYGYYQLFPATGSNSGAVIPFKFYRMQVSLTHVPDNKPINLDVMIGCGAYYQQSGGSGVSSSFIRVPNIYGIALENGAGVLVQTPNICSLDPKKDIPPDFMPMVLYAPDAKDLEFMIAYVSERAYEQKVSKLRFHKTVITLATKQEYAAWKKTASNIVPESKKIGRDYRSFFGSAYFSKSDIRYGRGQFICHTVAKFPIPADMKDFFRSFWPKDKPQYWVPKIPRKEFEAKFSKALGGKYLGRINGKYRREEIASGTWGRDSAMGGYYHGLPYGISRRSGVGSLKEPRNIPRYLGEADRIPFRTSTGYPWLSEKVKSTPMLPFSGDFKKMPDGEPQMFQPLPRSFDGYLDIADGAGKGFAYCYRDDWLAFGDVNLTRTEDLGEKKDKVKKQIFVDGKLVAAELKFSFSRTYLKLVKKDEFLFSTQKIGLVTRGGASEMTSAIVKYVAAILDPRVKHANDDGWF